MKTSTIRKLGVLGIPLIALAVAVLVLAWGHSANNQVEAAGEGDPGVDFSLRSDDCIGGPVDTKAGDTKCNIGLGSTFTIAVDLNSYGGLAGYDGFDASLAYAGVTSKDNATFSWPDCVFGAPSYGVGTVLAGCGIGIGAPSSVYTGELVVNDFNCTADPSVGGVTLIHGAASGDTNLADSAGGGHAEKGTETLVINCVPPPTDTPTPTPPPIPKVEKDPALSNLFLVAQTSGKLPPVRCEDDENVAALDEQLSQEIVTTVPPGFGKDSTEDQELAAFQFEVRYDPKLVCVDIAEADGAGEGAENMTCATVTAKGLVRIGCFTIKQTDEFGENITVYPDTSTEAGQTLAVVSVRPQPELYSQIIAAQANGIPVQILDQDCQLNDQYGHDIPIFSCDDADITIRFLEGDVVPGGDSACVVDATDEQAMAFRWGAEKGNLLYNERFDLVPSGQVNGDGYIHIGDLQMVFGRHNSTCDDPNPVQDPINPKEKDPV